MDMRAYRERLASLDAIVTSALNDKLTAKDAPAVPMTIYCLAQVMIGWLLRKADALDKVHVVVNGGLRIDRDALTRLVVRTLLTQQGLSPALRAALEPASQEPRKEPAS